jgi:hypothetical protein
MDNLFGSAFGTRTPKILRAGGDAPAERSTQLRLLSFQGGNNTAGAAQVRFEQIAHGGGLDVLNNVFEEL